MIQVLNRLARRSMVCFLGLTYPPIVAVDVVVTGNHYLLDVGGAVTVVLVTTLVALPI